MKRFALHSDEEHPEVTIGRNNLGAAWNSLGQYGKANDYYELALVTFEQVVSDRHPSTQTVRCNLAATRAGAADSKGD